MADWAAEGSEATELAASKAIEVPVPVGAAVSRQGLAVARSRWRRSNLRNFLVQRRQSTGETGFGSQPRLAKNAAAAARRVGCLGSQK